MSYSKNSFEKLSKRRKTPSDSLEPFPEKLPKDTISIRVPNEWRLFQDFLFAIDIIHDFYEPIKYWFKDFGKKNGSIENLLLKRLKASYVLMGYSYSNIDYLNTFQVDEFKYAPVSFCNADAEEEQKIKYVEKLLISMLEYVELPTNIILPTTEECLRFYKSDKTSVLDDILHYMPLLRRNINPDPKYRRYWNPLIAIDKAVDSVQRSYKDNNILDKLIKDDGESNILVNHYLRVAFKIIMDKGHHKYLGDYKDVVESIFYSSLILGYDDGENKSVINFIFPIDAKLLHYSNYVDKNPKYFIDTIKHMTELYIDKLAEETNLPYKLGAINFDRFDYNSYLLSENHKTPEIANFLKGVGAPKDDWYYPMDQILCSSTFTLKNGPGYCHDNFCGRDDDMTDQCTLSQIFDDHICHPYSTSRYGGCKHFQISYRDQRGVFVPYMNVDLEFIHKGPPGVKITYYGCVLGDIIKKENRIEHINYTKNKISNVLFKTLADYIQILDALASNRIYYTIDRFSIVTAIPLIEYGLFFTAADYSLAIKNPTRWLFYDRLKNELPAYMLPAYYPEDYHKFTTLGIPPRGRIVTVGPGIKQRARDMLEYYQKEDIKRGVLGFDRSKIVSLTNLKNMAVRDLAQQMEDIIQQIELDKKSLIATGDIKRLLRDIEDYKSEIKFITAQYDKQIKTLEIKLKESASKSIASKDNPSLRMGHFLTQDPYHNDYIDFGVFSRKFIEFYNSLALSSDITILPEIRYRSLVMIYHRYYSAMMYSAMQLDMMAFIENSIFPFGNTFGVYNERGVRNVQQDVKPTEKQKEKDKKLGSVKYTLTKEKDLIGNTKFMSEPVWNFLQTQYVTDVEQRQKQCIGVLMNSSVVEYLATN